jgi:LPS-assembly protein
VARLCGGLLALLLAQTATVATAVEIEPGVCPQPPLAAAMPPARTDDRLILTADQAFWEQNGLSTLAGDVRLTQRDAEFVARALDYDSAAQRVSVKAESLFRNSQFVIKSQSAEFDLANETGSFLNTEFLFTEGAAHGSADSITLARAGTVDLKGAEYTTCAPEHEMWLLSAGSIHMDQDKGRGTARNAVLRFAGIPILYAPYFQFPIDDQRHTGLLFPLIGNSNITGFDIRWPVYFNLAPNYDLQLVPRYMSKRGVQIGSDFRYLLRKGVGHARYEFLDEDQVADIKRSYFEYDHVSLLSRRLGLDVNYSEVSDPGYFEDLGGRLDSTSISYLERSARLTYQVPASYTIEAMVEGFQTVTRTVEPLDKPYKRLPRISVDALTRKSWHNLRTGIDGEFVNFARPADQEVVQGQRMNVQPYVRYLVDHNAWYVSSQVDFQYTRYLLTDTAEGQQQSPSRQLPIVSTETGLRFERLTARGGLQTLEPRLLYLYVPFRDQDDLPLFDSGEPDFDFAQLFARNRFSGEDRVSDANHLAAALTTRLLDPHSGVVRFSGSIGQIYRFEAPHVGLPDTDIPDSGVTDYIAAIDYRLTQTWSMGGATQWSPDLGRFVRTGAALRYRSDRTTYDVAYRFRLGLLEQVDTSLRLPVFESWRLAGRLRYEIGDGRTLESLAGVEYSGCCWAAQLSYRRYITNSNGDYSNGIYFQLELKGLTRIGSSYDSFLPESR